MAVIYRNPILAQSKDLSRLFSAISAISALFGSFRLLPGAVGSTGSGRERSGAHIKEKRPPRKVALGCGGLDELDFRLFQRIDSAKSTAQFTDEQRIFGD